MEPAVWRQTLRSLFTATVEMHPGYKWNKDATRIRCIGCGEVLEADEASVQSVYSGHQGKAFDPFADELGDLRVLAARIGEAVVAAPGGSLPHGFLTDLAQALSEVGSGDREVPASFVVTNALSAVNRQLEFLELEDGVLPGPPADETPAASDVIPEAETAEAPPEPEADPEPLPETEPAAEAPQPEPAPAKAAAAVAALDWMGELPDGKTPEPEAPARKPRKKKEWKAREIVPVFDESNRDALDSISAGDRVSARFITAVDGDFTIEATVIEGAAGNSLIAGSMVLSARGEPGLYLHSVNLLEPAAANPSNFIPSTEPEHFGPSA